MPNMRLCFSTSTVSIHTKYTCDLSKDCISYMINVAHTSHPKRVSGITIELYSVLKDTCIGIRHSIGNTLLLIRNSVPRSLL